jgi:hypothetical protein
MCAPDMFYDPIANEIHGLKIVVLRLAQWRILTLLPVSDGKVVSECARPRAQQREKYGPAVILLRTRKSVACGGRGRPHSVGSSVKMRAWRSRGAGLA